MSEQTIQAALSQVDEHIIQMVNKFVLSGMAVGIVHDGRLVYAKGFGVADARTKRPLTADTVFRAASISKTFTAIAVMQLWEQGKFQLDDPINQHLKSYRVQHSDPTAPHVTIRHLLTHTSGIGEMRTSADLIQAMLREDWDEYRPGDVLPTLAEYYNGNLVPELHPGRKWAYANNAYATLGQLIEDISGEPFSDYMLHHVIQPLGMVKSDFAYSELVRGDLAQGYTFKKGRLEAQDLKVFPGGAAGMVFTTINEMAKYMTALMNGGRNDHGAVLQPETLDSMMQPHYQPDPHLGGMGLGFFIEDLDGHRAAWHGGALAGFNSVMWVAPDDKLGVIVWANSNTRAIYHFGENILRSLLGLPDVAERLPVPGLLNSPHIWPELVGSYGPLPGFNTNARIWLGFGGEMEVLVRGSELVLRSLTGPMKTGIVLHPVDPNDPYVFESVNDGKITQVAFKCDSTGKVERMEVAALAFYTFYKRPFTESLRFKAMVAGGALLGLLGAGLLRGLTGGRRSSASRNCCAGRRRR